MGQVPDQRNRERRRHRRRVRADHLALGRGRGKCADRGRSRAARDERPVARGDLHELRRLNSVQSRTKEDRMFGKIFIKEWRDNLALFALGVIVLLGVLGLHLGHQDKAALFTLGAFLMFVLPGLAFLIGASGFQNEFKNNSWTYLFSRPVAKPCIWTAKYVSQLSILAVLVGLWAALRLLAPGLGRLLGQLDWPADHLSIGSAGLFLPAAVLVFTAAFSMSFLSDR